MYVYVMQNVAIPDLVKVGYSDNPVARAQELNTTGVPGRWRVFARFCVVDKRAAETAAHRALVDAYEGKEFFRITPESAAKRVAKAIDPWHVAHPRAPDDWARWADPGKWQRQRDEEAARQRARQRQIEDEAAAQSKRDQAEREKADREKRRRRANFEKFLIYTFFIWLLILGIAFNSPSLFGIPIGDPVTVLVLSVPVAAAAGLYFWEP